MHAITINKKLDYSIPIIFKPYVTVPAPVAKVVSAPTVATKPNPSAIQKPVVTKTPPKKPATQIKVEEKKSTTITASKNIEATTVKKEEKPKVEEKKQAPILQQVQDERKEIEKEIPTSVNKQNTAPAAVEKKQPLPDPAKPSSAGVPVRNEMEHRVSAITSDNFREVEALRRGAQLQKELVQKWQPPIGVSPDCSCEISFFVDKKGAIHQLKMVKSSGVVMFDISARQALFAMKMPQWTYGKPLTISFKQ